MTVDRLSEGRKAAIIELMKDAVDGNFVIVHQDWCSCKKHNICDCVPDVWAVKRGKA